MEEKTTAPLDADSYNPTGNNPGQLPTSESREAQILRASAVSVATNVLLSAFKAAVGLIANSVAVLLDGVNSLSDAISSIITIIGMRLASRPPDRKHPYGHGRIEYFSAVIVAAIVLAAGIVSLVESVRKIIAPEPSDFTPAAIAVIVVAIVAKLILGLYVRRVGRKTRSDSLAASGADALFDAVITLSTLVSAIIMLVWDISLDGILGALISVVIIRSGIEMLNSPVQSMIGSRIDTAFSRGIKELVSSNERVEGAYDLVLHNYGPENYVGSIHIAVPDTMIAGELDRLTRRVQAQVFRTFGVFLTVGVYATNVTDPEAAKIEHDIRDITARHPEVLQTHGVFVDKESRSMTFDIIIDFSCDDAAQVRDEIADEVRRAYPDWDIGVAIDRDYSD